MTPRERFYVYVLWTLAAFCFVMSIGSTIHNHGTEDDYEACKRVLAASSVDGTLPLNPPHDPFSAKSCQALSERDRNLAWLDVMMDLQRFNDGR